MGQITVQIPDEVERKLRIRVAEKYGGKRGALGEAIAEGIELWLKQK
jgi:plasmid stability protein